MFCPSHAKIHKILLLKIVNKKMILFEMHLKRPYLYQFDILKNHSNVEVLKIEIVKCGHLSFSQNFLKILDEIIKSCYSLSSVPFICRFCKKKLFISMHWKMYWKWFHSKADNSFKYIEFNMKNLWYLLWLSVQVCVETCQTNNWE